MKIVCGHHDVLYNSFVFHFSSLIQIDNLNKRWGRIRERANTRQGDLEKTAGRLKTLQQTIHDVEEGLEKAETQQRNQRPVGAEVEMVKQQMKEFKVGSPFFLSAIYVSFCQS